MGPAAFALVPALVVAGCLLAPATWHAVWDAAHNGPPAIRPVFLGISQNLDNILLLQIRIGILFPLFVFLGLRARNSDSGFHKRMMITAPAMALPAAFDRIEWIPHTLPHGPLSTDLYPLLALAPCWRGICSETGASIALTGSCWPSICRPRCWSITPGTSHGGTRRSGG